MAHWPHLIESLSSAISISPDQIIPELTRLDRKYEEVQFSDFTQRQNLERALAESISYFLLEPESLRKYDPNVFDFLRQSFPEADVQSETFPKSLDRRSIDPEGVTAAHDLQKAA